jgi:hypothetical protein
LDAGRRLRTTEREIASVSWNLGPPLRSSIGCPSNSNSTVITLPAGTGPVSPQRESFTMREFGKMKA